MTRLLALVPLAGCAVGAGSAYVGQWSPREEVEFEACLVDEAGRCVDRKQVIQEVPGRRFWGVIIALPAIGGSSVAQNDTTTSALRVEPSFELLRGSGRWAYGLRASPVIDNADKTVITAAMLTGIGRISVLPRLNLYGGIGFAPYAAGRGQHAFTSERALVGAQLALSKTHAENFIILSVEADTMFIQFDDPYRSSGLTGSIGLFF
jgi:hypothetical protein